MNPKAPRLALAISLAAGLCACASAPKEAAKPPPPMPSTPLEQYALQASRTPQRVALAVHPRGLSATQQAVLTDFVGRWRDNGEGDLEVEAPVGSGDGFAARRMADATTLFLRQLGVPSGRLRLSAYDARQTPVAPVVVSFSAFAATVPDCSHGWSNLVATKDNNPQTHFGCAETANIAAMIANPRDIVTPAQGETSDGVRREVVLQKYRQGVPTSTTADSQASGTVSTQ